MQTQLLPMTQRDLQAKLKVMAARSRSMTGFTFQRDRDANGNLVGETKMVLLSEKLPKFFEELLASTTDPEKIRQRNEFLSRCATDPKAALSLNAIRIETFNNYIMATNNIREFFFETVTLKPDERPVFNNTTMNEVKVYYNGPAGEPKLLKVDRDDQQELKNLHYLVTDKVRYRKVDIYRGSIVDSALETLKLAYDWANQADGVAFGVLNTSTVFGDFVFTGKKQNYPYVANSRINTSNFPTSNSVVIYLDNTTKKFKGLVAASASAPASSAIAGGFVFPVFNAIKGYCGRWAGADPSGELLPTGRILVPGADLETFGNDVTATSSKMNVPAEKLLENGWTGVHYLGTDWILIPDNTLAPGTCFPEFTQKAGRVYYKPSLDEEKIINNDDLDEKNEEERKMKKVFGCEINSASRRKLLKIRYA